MSKGFAVIFNFAVLGGGAEGKRDKGWGSEEREREEGVWSGDGWLKWGLIGSDDVSRCGGRTILDVSDN